MMCAYCVRSPPCSTGLSSGPSACDHWLSVRPSQKSHALCAVPATGIVRRAVAPTPVASGTPSWNSLSGRWQDAHDTLPFALSRVSKNNALPSEAATESSDQRLLGSGASGGRLASDRLASVPRSLPDQRASVAACVSRSEERRVGEE